MFGGAEGFNYLPLLYASAAVLVLIIAFILACMFHRQVIKGKKEVIDYAAQRLAARRGGQGGTEPTRGS